MKEYSVFGMGAALVDTQIRLNEQKLKDMDVEKGVMTLVDEARQGELLEQLSGNLLEAKHESGGSAGNSMIAASGFGSKTFMCCKVSDDQDGDIYISDLDRCGVSHNLKNNRTSNEATGKCLVLITPDAERSMSTFLGVSETLSSQQLDYEVILDSEYVYLEGYLVTSPTCKEAAVQLRTYAKENGIKTALSFSDPGIVSFFRDGILEIIGDKLDLIFCNEDEALSWANTDKLEDALSEIKKITKTFVVTLGSKGAITFDGKIQNQISPENVEAIDTNGAGDMFAGAFLHAITRGESYLEAGKFANFAASKIVQHFGPRLPFEEYSAIKEEFYNKSSTN